MHVGGFRLRHRERAAHLARMIPPRDAPICVFLKHAADCGLLTERDGRAGKQTFHFRKRKE